MVSVWLWDHGSIRKNKKQKTDQIIRIEELEALMQKYGISKSTVHMDV